MDNLVIAIRDREVDAKGPFKAKWWMELTEQLQAEREVSKGLLGHEYDTEKLRADIIEGKIEDTQDRQAKCMWKSKTVFREVEDSETESDDEGERIADKKKFYAYEEAGARRTLELWEIEAKIRDIKDSYQATVNRVSPNDLYTGYENGYMKDDYGILKDKGVSISKKRIHIPK